MANLTASQAAEPASALAEYGCGVCSWLRRASDEAEAGWRVARASLAGVAEEPAPGEFRRRHSAEVAARAEVDVIRLAIEKHVRVHSAPD
jgi:hypothetical protein